MLLGSGSAAARPGAGEKEAMRLTLWTDYALRTLIYVGAKGGRLATIAEIAESFDISKTHLMKVVSRLGQQG
jgi:Rrf2 family nitric oxide-sensitive transcriptional repressor